MNFTKTLPSDCEVRSIIKFLIAKNESGAEIHGRSCVVYSEEHRHCYEKTSYVSNYVFFISSHKWVDRGQTLQLKKLLCV